MKRLDGAGALAFINVLDALLAERDAPLRFIFYGANLASRENKYVGGESPTVANFTKKATLSVLLSCDFDSMCIKN